MEYLEIIILIFFIAVLGYEGYSAVKRFLTFNQTVKETVEKKPGAVVTRDYAGFLFLYSFVGMSLLVYSYTYFMQDNKIYAAIMGVFGLFSFVFCLDTVVQKTMVFYDSGFLYNQEHKKYRSVVRISDKHKFAKGFAVRMTNNEEVFVTKRGRAVLEEKMQSYAERKKNR